MVKKVVGSDVEAIAASKICRVARASQPSVSPLKTDQVLLHSFKQLSLALALLHTSPCALLQYATKGHAMLSFLRSGS